MTPPITIYGPRCWCGEKAIARIAWLLADGTEDSRSRPMCNVHYQLAMDLLDKVQLQGPLHYLIVAPDSADGRYGPPDLLGNDR